MKIKCYVDLYCTELPIRESFGVGFYDLKMFLIKILKVL